MKTRSLTLRTTAVLATSMLLTGCGISTSYTPLNAPPHKLHARTPAQVEVFEGKEPERAHIEVGAIDVRQQASNHARKEELFARMRDMGAQHGCDAVKIVGRTDYRNRVGYRAACIVYDEPRPQVPATPMEISRSNPYPDIAEPVVAKPTP